MNNYLIMKVNILCSVGQSDLCDPHGLQSARLLCPWKFPGKNTGVFASVCQEMFATSYSNYSRINRFTPNYKCVMDTTCSGCGDRNSANKVEQHLPSWRSLFSSFPPPPKLSAQLCCFVALKSEARYQSLSQCRPAVSAKLASPHRLKLQPEIPGTHASSPSSPCPQGLPSTTLNCSKWCCGFGF